MTLTQQVMKTDHREKTDPSDAIPPNCYPVKLLFFFHSRSDTTKSTNSLAGISSANSIVRGSIMSKSCFFIGEDSGSRLTLFRTSASATSSCSDVDLLIATPFVGDLSHTQRLHHVNRQLDHLDAFTTVSWRSVTGIGIGIGNCPFAIPAMLGEVDHVASPRISWAGFDAVIQPLPIPQWDDGIKPFVAVVVNALGLNGLTVFVSLHHVLFLFCRQLHSLIFR